MRGRTCNRALVLFLPMALATLGCVRTSAPLDLTSLDPNHDQRKIASFHSREAAYFRVKAQEFAERIVVYESLFGPESEWVHGARLLEQFYEAAADEQDKLANVHLNIAAEERPFPIGRRGTPFNDGHPK